MSVSQEKPLAYSVSSPSGALWKPTQTPKIIINISIWKILRFKALRSQRCFSVLQKSYVTNYSSGLTWPHGLNHKYTNRNPCVCGTVKHCKLFYKCDLYVIAFLKYSGNQTIINVYSLWVQEKCEKTNIFDLIWKW